MLKSIERFSINYFTPSVECLENNKLSKRLKIISYFTLVIPIVIAFLWCSNRLFGRVKRIFISDGSVASKINQTALKQIIPKKDPTCEAAFFVAKTIFENRTVEDNYETLFDSKSVSQETIHFMKNIKLGDIQFEESENPDKFKVVRRNHPNTFIEFSNRASSAGELRANLLKYRLAKILSIEGGEHKTLYDAITEICGSVLKHPIYLHFKKAAPLLSPEINLKKLDELVVQIFDLLKKGEKVDEDTVQSFKPTRGYNL